MRQRFFFLLAALICLFQVAHADTPKDPTLQPIAREVLQQMIAKTPLDAVKVHSRLIGQAYASNLVSVAYDAYTPLWRKNQNNAYANYWRGVTAHLYWWRASYPSTGIHLEQEQKSRLWQTAKTCLSKAVKLKPDFASANATYGAFLFEQPGSEKRGLELIRKSVQLAPESAGMWRTLGEALINPYGKAYKPEEGEQALLKAIRINSSYAAPHYALIRFYIQQKRFKEAQRELEIYTGLVPNKSADSTIAFFKPQIDKGL